jgi:hypothetical protein
MRTTLTIDDSLAARLKKRAADLGIPFKTLITQVLQLGLNAMAYSKEDAGMYKTETKPLGPSAGIDLDKIGRLADKWEDEETVAEK